MLYNCLELIMIQADIKKIQLDLDCRVHDTLLMFNDRERIQAVIINLLLFALKNTFSGNIKL